MQEMLEHENFLQEQRERQQIEQIRQHLQREREREEEEEGGPSLFETGLDKFQKFSAEMVSLVDGWSDKIELSLKNKLSSFISMPSSGYSAITDGTNGTDNKEYKTQYNKTDSNKDMFISTENQDDSDDNKQDSQYNHHQNRKNNSKKRKKDNRNKRQSFNSSENPFEQENGSDDENDENELVDLDVSKSQKSPNPQPSDYGADDDGGGGGGEDDDDDEEPLNFRKQKRNNSEIIQSDHGDNGNNDNNNNNNNNNSKEENSVSLSQPDKSRKIDDELYPL